MTPQKSVDISNWVQPDSCAAQITAWPLGSSAVRHPELHGRVAVAIDCGAASVSLRPTADEVRALIRVLEWALEPVAIKEAA